MIQLMPGQAAVVQSQTPWAILLRLRSNWREERKSNMGIALTREQVLALAPDDSSAKAAAGLVSDSKWGALGADAEAVWGECQGSGAKPYLSQVDLAAMVSRCSCPSRKFPCKHGLALLLLYAQGNPRFANTVRPAWVEEWLASRRERAEKKDRAAETAATKAAVDPGAAAAAVAKREQARWKRIETGAGELQRWIADQFRHGLARFGSEQRQDWRAMAARMVDAQAPALGTRLHEALDLMQSDSPRHLDVVERLGLLQLIVEGVNRRDRLSASRLADLRAALGWPADKEEVIAVGEGLQDLWCVLGQVTTEPETKLSERRVWLRGARSSRYALLQDFAYAGRGWDQVWLTGAHHRATLRFYPGSVPLRALATEVAPEASEAAVLSDSIEDAIDGASQALANNPWLAHVPLALSSATLTRQAESWMVHFPSGTLPALLSEQHGWDLMAFSGGHCVGMMGEWDGYMLRVLSAWDQHGERWASEPA